MIDPLFTANKLNAEGIGKVERIRIDFDVLMSYLNKRVPSGREFSICKTNLETACMYAIKAVSLAAENRE